MVACLEADEDGRADVPSGLKQQYNASVRERERPKLSSITINLREEQMARLQEIACRLGISVEDLARVSLEELLAAPDERFEHAADYVLKKNEDLYRRFA
ncbi:MAG TPA: ribbon-helix-helix protein, CopG family [Pyrinomonadaceae bacterium]|nr:ribbon-helix-helix protein, CopG family [Pyrinomonadaceae bacterium]